MLCLVLILFTEILTVSLYSGKARHEDIILDGKVYRPVGDYQGDRESKIMMVLKWLLSPFVNLWTHQEDLHNENDEPFQPRFSFLSKTEFKPKYGLNSNSFQEKLKPYKPRYVFKQIKEFRTVKAAKCK